MLRPKESIDFFETHPFRNVGISDLVVVTIYVSEAKSLFSQHFRANQQGLCSWIPHSPAKFPYEENLN